MSDNTTTTPAAEEKTFSQDDVNRIVSERLAKEKSKADATIAQREQELAQREFLLTAKTTLTEKGLPVELLDALNTSSPEAFEQSLRILEQHSKSTARETPPPYAVGTGSTPVIGYGNADETIRRGMGLK